MAVTRQAESRRMAILATLQAVDVRLFGRIFTHG